MKLCLYRTLLDSETRMPVLQVDRTFVREPESYNNAESVWKMLEETVQLGSLAEEHVFLVALDSKYHAKGIFEVSHGSTDTSMAPIPEILRMLLISGGTSMMIAHNHPSGDPTPSEEDATATRNLVLAAKIVGVSLAEHLVVGNGLYCSLRDQQPELFR